MTNVSRCQKDELYRRFQCARDLMITVRDDPNSKLCQDSFYDVEGSFYEVEYPLNVSPSGHVADLLIADDAYHNGCTACFAGWLRIDPVARSILPPRDREHPITYTRRFFAGHRSIDFVIYQMFDATEDDVIEELQRICLETTGQRLSKRWQQ